MIDKKILDKLLGREPVLLNNTAIFELIQNKVILVTGAGGSIGSELCRQIVSFNPSKIILLDQSEPALFTIEQELNNIFKEISIEPIVASICNESRIEYIFRKFSPQIVFHAAAHKHVPLMERQPSEAVLNNSIGTLIVSRSASEHGCEKFILVSTDKAVNPTNVMGATKRVAELVINSMQKRIDNETIFSSVRFGNVLGSSGSVVPTFIQQITNGGPVTVTHPEIYRFFMSISEAVGLILQSATQSEKGDVFILDMGRSIKIYDLAKQLIELHEFVPNKDIEIKFIGLRLGEKLYEEPIHQSENVYSTNHPKLYRLVNNDCYTDIVPDLKYLQNHLNDMSDDEIKKWLNNRVPEYIIF